jgi:hypothetical protein
MEYSTPDINSTNEKLEQAMNAEMDTWNIRDPQLEKTLHLAANSVEVCLDSIRDSVFPFDHWYTAVLLQLQFRGKEKHGTLHLVPYIYNILFQ